MQDVQTPATFHLAPALPGQVTVAGDFAPAEGRVRLYGIGPKLRVRLKGQCLSCDVPNTWLVEATRAAWIGEFIEPRRRPYRMDPHLVGVRGFEPPAPASRTQCSTRLSYTPTEGGRIAPARAGGKAHNTSHAHGTIGFLKRPLRTI